MKRHLTACFIVCLALQAIAADKREPIESDEQWYVLRMLDQPVGWATIRVSEKDNVISSGMDMSMAVKRGPVELKIKVESAFRESSNGKPLSALTKQTLGALTIEHHLTFTDTGIEQVTRQGGRELKKTLPLPKGEWLPPTAAGLFVEEQLAKGMKEIKVRTFEATSLMSAFDMTIQIGQQSVIEVFGRQVPAIEQTIVTSILPGMKTTRYVDDKGRMLKEIQTIAGMKLVMEASDKELAMAQVSPPELLVSSLINADRTIPNARQTRKGKYRLTVTEGEFPEVPSTAVQSVQKVADNAVLVSIDLDAPKPASGTKSPQDKPEIVRSVMIDGEDPKIRELAKQALGKDWDGSVPDRAEKLRRFAFEYIDEKDMSVGLASASEVAQTKTGDCTEHGVFLAALLQANGIPSRVASGLIYVDRFMQRRHVFGYHMWTQAWIDGRWVDLDGTFPPQRSFDATHITLNVTTMDDGATNDMLNMIPLFGKLQIKVE